MELKEAIRKYALQNAIKYEGKANPGNLVGRLMGEFPEMRAKAKDLMKEIQDIVKEVNKLGLEKQTEELKNSAPELLEKKVVEKEDLKPLKNATEGKIVMRFAPSPSGPMHIGHAYPLSLNSEYARKYKGKLILRIEDTNPEKIYDKAYDMIPDEAKWITKDNISEIYFQSDRMDSYYKYAEEIITKGHAYVCTCKAEDFREMKIKGIPCPCRNNEKSENLKRWKNMFEKYKEGDAVLRIKTNINHKNPAMRDWPAFRINEHVHPRQKNKYKVWPLMNFAVSIDDHDMGLTHTLRAKDHIDNEKRQKFIYDYMGWKMAETIYVGKINFEDMKVKCSYTRPLVETGEFEGWDDIRLPFLSAMRRRGYQPEAFIKYALDVGVTQNDKKVSKLEFFKQLDHFNKEIIESTSNRFFFIKEPVEVKIEGAPSQEVELDLHPDNKKGGRKFKTNENFYLAKTDLDLMKDGNIYRLMDCLNLKKEGDSFKFHSLDYKTYKKSGAGIIHWLPKDEKTIPIEVRMPDNSINKGIGEAGMSSIKEGDIIQMERFAFVRLDKKDKSKLEFWFTHN